jgi:hypothetical protein
MDENPECEGCGEIYDLESYDLLGGQEPVILCTNCYLDEVAAR